MSQWGVATLPALRAPQRGEMPLHMEAPRSEGANRRPQPLGPGTKIGSERLGHSSVEYYTPNRLGDLLFEVDEVYRTRDYTQARIFDGATQKIINLWYRYDGIGGTQRTRKTTHLNARTRRY